MYVPRHFEEHDTQRVLELIDEHAFATLISVADAQPMVSHLPLLHRAEEHCLVGHVARASPHARMLADDAPVLAIFHGPHGYVSPSWYLHPGVPTWNYAVVHVRGHATALDDAAAATVLEQLTARYEARLPQPWTVDYAPAMLQAIHAFSIRIESIEAKFKLNQNRPTEDRRRVVDQFHASGRQELQDLARLMRVDESP